MPATIFETDYQPGVIQPEILSQLLRSCDDLLNVPKPKISVITLSLNLAGFLEDTIRSVANQSYRNFEHIVVDGGSIDGSLEILKKYPHLKWVSEKDGGPVEAMWKGINRAKGEYIMACYVSDGYANKNWLKYCADFLDSNPDVSLVGGLAQYLSEQGVVGSVSYPSFISGELPQKEKLFSYELKISGAYFEGNLCVRKQVLEKCYPKVESTYIIDWNQFALNFNRGGYLACILPVVANFGRTHSGQMGEKIKKTGLLRKMGKNFLKAYRNYRFRVIFGMEQVNFIGPNGQKLNINFDRNKFFKEYLGYIFSRERFLGKIKFYIYIFKRIPFKLKQLIKETS